MRSEIIPAHVGDVMANMTGVAEKFAAMMGVIESQMREVWLAGATARAVPQQQGTHGGFGAAPQMPPREQPSHFNSGLGLGQQPQFQHGLGLPTGLGHNSRPAQQQWPQQPPQNRQGAGPFWIGESGGSQGRIMFDGKIAVTKTRR